MPDAPMVCFSFWVVSTSVYFGYGLLRSCPIGRAWGLREHHGFQMSAP